ncbi:MAG: hypothetical protein AMXMBFR59_23410 [Rhodanobacteraceae bacterium]
MRAPVLAVILLALAGCAGDDPPAPQAPPPKPTTVIDPQLKALERAKAVQDQVDAQKAATDAKLREAEGQ